MIRDIQVEFDEGDWARIESDWTAWWEGELERPLVMIHGYQPRAGEEASSASLKEYVTREVLFTSEFPLETPIDEVLDFYEVHLERKRYYGDAWPRWWPNFGPGIIAGFLGSRVKPVRGTVWFEPSEETALEDLHPRYDPENVWWQRIHSLTRSAVERWGSQVSIAHTDLGGNLDILASLRTTEQLLFDVSDASDEVERVIREITELWLRYYNELDALIQKGGRGTTPWAPVWSPGRCYMLQSDFSYMISPEMFERFVLPDIASCCDALDHGFYHLDGKGQIKHLDLLLSVDRLRGIQWIPGDGQPQPEEWLPLLKRIVDGGKRCQLYVTAEGARKIIEEIGGKGFALFVINVMHEAEAQEFLQSVDAGRQGS